MNGYYAMVLLPLCCGCGQTLQRSVSQAAEPELSPPPAHRQVRETTGRLFASAAFLLPQSEPQSDLPVWMLPLIVQELGPQTNGPGQAHSFGALKTNPAGETWIDTSDPTLYVLSDSVRIGRRDFPQRTFLWYYPSSPPGQALRYRGYRTVLDSRGFEMLWEVLSSEPGPRVFYVTDAVEAAAAQAYGQRLPGRQFYVEPSLLKQPQVLVARLLAEGPQPMGPFVYLDHPGSMVTTLLCRCMPSQVEVVARKASYRLVGLKTLDDLRPAGTSPSQVPLPRPGTAWDTVLRIRGQCVKLFNL